MASRSTVNAASMILRRPEYTGSRELHGAIAKTLHHADAEVESWWND
jgi:hypothetical protein